MKTVLTACALLSCCSLLCAQPAPAAAAKPGTLKAQPRISDPAVRSNMLAKTGGLIQSKTEGPCILFLNTQSQIKEDVIQDASGQICKILRLPISFRNEISSVPITKALSALSDKDIGSVVVVAHAPGYPSLLIAPENRWAMVNVAALSGENAPAQTVEERTQKEIWRAFAYLMGSAHSNFEHCLMKPVLQPTDLDAMKTKSLCPEPFNKILAQAQKLGMKPIRTTTYRKAVEEGWAPAPTNDIQRAIWNELKK